MALSDNIWWTRKARIQTEKRLLSNIRHTEIMLLWYSFFGVCISIYSLQAQADDKLSEITWVVFSVLVLCISGYINGLSLKQRSALTKECYETLQRLYQKAIRPDANIESISEEYEQILNICENHTDDDFYHALCIEYLTHPDPENKDKRIGLSKLPTKYIWFSFGWHKIKRFCIFSAFYIFPIALLALLKICK